jgi:peptide deformylase
MAILTILHYPDARLQQIAEPVTSFDAELQKLVRNMAETMYAAPGIGLAATQVDVHRQIIVVDISEQRDQLAVFVNPAILGGEGVSDLEEGCLSVPGIYDRIPRMDRIYGQALDVFGNSFSFELEGLLSVCLQHEMDHLRGRVFVEYLSRLKQDRILSKLRKQQKRLG